MWASAGEIGNVVASLWLGLIPSSAVLGCLRAGGGRPGAVAVYTPGRTESFLSQSSLAAGIDKRQAGGPAAHDAAPLCATSWAPDDARVRGDALRWLAKGEAHLRDHVAQGVGCGRTAGMPKAAVTDFPAALRENVWEEPAETRDDVQGSGAWACTAGLTGGDGDGTVFASHDTSIGEGAPEDRGGEGGAGRVAIGPRLRVAIPGAVPALWVEVLQPSGLAPVVFEEGTGERREGLNRDKAGGSGGEPGGAVR